MGFSICIFDSAKHAKISREKEKRNNNKGIEGDEDAAAVAMRQELEMPYVNPYLAKTVENVRDSVNDSYLASRTSLSANLNGPWLELFDDDTTPYYLHLKTGVTSWSVNEDALILSNEYAHRYSEMSGVELRDSSLRDDDREDTRIEEIEGWVVLQDSICIYCNLTTGEISKQRPKKWVNTICERIENKKFNRLSAFPPNRKDD